MRTVRTTTCNMVYLGNPALDIGDLDCQRISEGHVRSFWRPSREDIAAINDGAVIVLDIVTEPIPPVMVSVASVLEVTEEEHGA